MSLDDDQDEWALKKIQEVLQDTTGSCETGLAPPLPSFDVISTLVGIYNSHVGFIDEYQMLLAELLVSKSDYNCDRECRVFELLNKRYGEAALHKCEVMLNDIQQSKLLNRSIQEEMERAYQEEAHQSFDAVPQSVPVSAVIASYRFWPEPKEPDIILPPNVQEALEAYGKQYNQKKSPRTLKWRTGAGVVDLDITIGNETHNFKVSPVHAALICHFANAERIKENDLADSVGLDINSLKSRMSFWISNGIIGEKIVNGEVLYHSQRIVETTNIPIADDSDEELFDRRGSAETDSLKFNCFKTYIIDFLRHRGQEGARLDEIHIHLEKFVKQHRFDMSQIDLSNYLDNLKIEGEIEIARDFYKIRG